MTTEEIDGFLKKSKLPPNKYLKITMKKRNAIYGIFIKCKDANDLAAKNFWRIVPFTNLEEYQKTRDLNLSRLFNGSEFSKISIEN